MKIFEIMMFLLIFNIVISVVGAMNIYNIDNANSPIQSNYDTDDLGGPQAIYYFIGTGSTIFILGTLMGAIGGYFVNKVLTVEGVVYAFFVGLITSVFTTSSGILWSITQIYEGYGLEWIVGLFIAVCGVLFAFGLVQLARGGIGGMV